MAHIHDESIAWGVENAMQRDGQLDNAEIWTEMPAGLRQNFDEFIAHFLRELRKVFFAQRFDVRWRMDSIEQALRRVVRFRKV